MAAPAPLLFEPNALYILLLDRGDTYLFHWELYLATSTREGTAFHITNDAGPAAWEYERVVSAEIPQLRRLLLALKIGSLAPVLHHALSERLAVVPLNPYSVRFRERLSCRVWVKEALFALDDEGYVNLGWAVDEVEEEAKYLAMLHKSKGERKVLWSRAFVG